MIMTTQPQPNLDSLARSEPLKLQISAVLALCGALLGFASGSILMRIATQEMTANQIAFDRVAIAAITFALWNGIRSVTSKSDASFSIGQREVGLLIAAGSSFAAFVVLLAWSLAHTQIANASLFTHMMPIFTAFGSWLFLGRRFSNRFWLGLGVALGNYSK
jgi:drug/metabolite transporter (DMT)-like permease